MVVTPGGRAGRELPLAELVPALVATFMFVVLIPAEGGFPARVWYPAGLFLLGLAFVLAVSRGRPMLPATRGAALAAAAFAAFTAWSFLSIVWADVPGLAWEGANRTLLYLLAFAVLASVPIGARSATAVLSVFVVATAGGALVVLLRGLDDPESVFVGGRFAIPTDYANANAAFYLIALWPALLLAADATLPGGLRAFLLGCAGVLAELALICQSRGSAAAAGITALLVIALAPDRLRLVAAIALVGATVALAAPPLLEETNQVVLDQADLSQVVPRLLVTLLITLGVLTAVGWGLARLEGQIGKRTRRLPLIVTGAAAGVVLLVVLALGIATGHSPRAALEDLRGDVEEQLETSRYGSSGSKSRRGEHWRVALGEFRRRPVGGMGADNFGVAYIRERSEDAEEPLYPHSLPIRVVSQTGVVGTALFAVFLAAGLVAALRRRPGGRAARSAAVAAVSPFAYWFIHGAGDWLWEFPGLSLPALGYLGMAAAIGVPERVEVGRAGRPLAFVGAVAVAAAGLLALGSFAASWWSVRELEAGLATWRSSPSAADAHFDRARRLNPLTDVPDAAAGVVAGRRGQLREMRDAFERALERNSKSWYSHLELGLVDAAEGKRSSALAHLRVARTLNPKERVLIDVERRIRNGERVPIREVDAVFSERVGVLAD